jgi:hypothetical protein
VTAAGLCAGGRRSGPPAATDDRLGEVEREILRELARRLPGGLCDVSATFHAQSGNFSFKTPPPALASISPR